MVENPDAEHVRVLWRIERDKRVQVWRRLGRFQEVRELELGGELSCLCPMNVEELFMLLPEGAGALAGLHKLFLWGCSDQVDDGFLRALASAGCGKMLTSLTLFCECSCVLVFSFDGVCGSGSGCVGCVCGCDGALSPLFSLLLFLRTRRSLGSDGQRAACAGLCRLREEADVADSSL